MDVEFTDPKLSLIETDQAAQTGLPVVVIQSARRKLNIVRAAPDEKTMMEWRSLEYTRVDGANGANGKIEIQSGWRMWLRLDPVRPKIEITELAVSH